MNLRLTFLIYYKLPYKSVDNDQQNTLKSLREDYVGL